MDKRVLKKFRNGQVVYDFNPADETPDSEHVNGGWGIVQKEKGLTYDTAKNKAMRRAEELSESCGYQVYTPCVACANCIIVRELEHGEYQNTAYACRMLKRMVERFGTCNQSGPGRTGPLVITRDKTMEEIESRKGELIN